jgi:hypothetical protein
LCGGEVVCAFVRREAVDEAADGGPQGVDGSLRGCSEQGLELGEGVLDRIEVGAVGRQEEQAGAGRLDGLADGGAFVAGQVVHDHDVAGTQLAHQHLLDVGLKGIAVDRAVEHHRRHHSGEAQTGHEGRGLPVAVGDAGAQPFTLGRPAMQARHAGGRPGLVDEHETLRIEVDLSLEPLLAPLHDVRPVLLGSMRCLFLRVMPWRLKKRHIVLMATPMPCSASRARSSPSVMSGVSSTSERINSP